jgi:hypothetical protein
MYQRPLDLFDLTDLFRNPSPATSVHHSGHGDIARHEICARREIAEQGLATRPEANTLPAIAEVAQAWAELLYAPVMVHAGSVTANALKREFELKARYLSWNGDVVDGAVRMHAFYLSFIAMNHERMPFLPIVGPDYDEAFRKTVLNTAQKKADESHILDTSEVRHSVYKHELELLVRFRRNGDFPLYPKGQLLISDDGEAFGISTNFMYSEFAKYLPAETTAVFRNGTRLRSAQPA